MYKVLIVEDENIIRKGLTYKVNWLKYNCVVVETAIDGKDGLSKIQKVQPDIVITDIRMPFFDGLKMLEESKGIFNYEAIIISGFGEFDYAKQAISLGVNEYLLKPISFEELEKAILKLIEKIDRKVNVNDKIKMHNDMSLYNELLNIQYIKYSDHSTKYVSNMLEYIKNNYNKKISINDVSEKYKVSTVYLNTKFKAETTYTFNDFLNRYRIIKAIEMLRNDDKLIYEIAESVGFQDYKYFSQVFKKYIGLSPTMFLDTLIK